MVDPPESRQKPHAPFNERTSVYSVNILNKQQKVSVRYITVLYKLLIVHLGCIETTHGESLPTVNHTSGF